jgi:hypothetical protein
VTTKEIPMKTLFRCALATLLAVANVAHADVPVDLTPLLEAESFRQNRADHGVLLPLTDRLVGYVNTSGRTVRYQRGDTLLSVDALVCAVDSGGYLTRCVPLVDPQPDSVPYSCGHGTCDCDNAGASWFWTWDCVEMWLVDCDDGLQRHPNQPDVGWCNSDSVCDPC